MRGYPSQSSFIESGTGWFITRHTARISLAALRTRRPNCCANFCFAGSGKYRLPNIQSSTCHCPSSNGQPSFRQLVTVRGLIAYFFASSPFVRTISKYLFARSSRHCRNASAIRGSSSSEFSLLAIAIPTILFCTTLRAASQDRVSTCPIGSENVDSGIRCFTTGIIFSSAATGAVQASGESGVSALILV